MNNTTTDESLIEPEKSFSSCNHLLTFPLATISMSSPPTIIHLQPGPDLGLFWLWKPWDGNPSKSSVHESFHADNREPRNPYSKPGTEEPGYPTEDQRTRRDYREPRDQKAYQKTKEPRRQPGNRRPNREKLETPGVPWSDLGEGPRVVIRVSEVLFVLLTGLLKLGSWKIL
ncbi:hypothetical protein L6452_17764 [Arctium lappa]|uniref:Uncharacterized protein n=1 Tax=Arctium lappa TaxID=4217 RepID=A0ACB9C4H6_ARCLA|nr:hypothetical protein L6452_17764 [Arctium lappa]